MKKIYYKILIALIILLLALYSGLKGRSDHELKVYVFSIGQGDAIFIETPHGEQILIDGGPDQKILEKLGKVMNLSDRYIDLVILTHPHDDHVAGLVPVLQRYDVGRLIYNGTKTSGQNYNYLLQVATEKNTPLSIPSGPSNISLTDNCNLKIIYPLTSLSGQELKNINNGSIASRLDCLDYSFLFMGDLEKKGEKELLANQQNLKAEVIKLGHHGSYTASSPDFLRAVSPNLAIISVGANNSYNLPASSTMDNLQDLGIKTWRTDSDGDFIFMAKTAKKP